jgi:hypothetical protein
MKVEVYRNLHKQCWSVRDNKTGKVIDHVRNIHIKDATLVVRPSGREKVLRERKKNVHAFVKGTIVSVNENLPDSWGYSTEITYNPYMYDSFVEKGTGMPVKKAKDIYLGRFGKAYTCSGFGEKQND